MRANCIFVGFSLLPCGENGYTILRTAPYLLVERRHVSCRVPISDRSVVLDDLSNLGELLLRELNVARRKVLDQVLFGLGLQDRSKARGKGSAQAL